MGRTRKTRRDLPPRVYVKHGAYYFVHPRGKWQRLALLGQEREMRVAWASLEQPNETAGTIAALLDEYLSQYAATAKAPRTFKDNMKEAEYLKAFFGEMLPQDIQARHIGAYLEENRTTRAVRANREKALLSHVFTWAMRHPSWGVTIQSNPCKGVTRNKESKRIRVVSDEHFLEVYKLANRNVQRLMVLIYRTLQRPSDILKLTPRNIIQREIDGEIVEVLQLKQSKTKTGVEIVLTDDIREALYGISKEANFKLPSNTPFILNRFGEAYTSSGITSNFTKAMRKFRRNTEIKEGVKPPGFGLYDIKGKGVTDMYQNGIPLEQIQALAGHESITTTEIYIKARLNKPITSNTRKIGS